MIAVYSVLIGYSIGIVLILMAYFLRKWLRGGKQ